mgnify:CR=1 FL=1
MTSRLLSVSRAATLITIVVMAWQVTLPVNLPQFDVADLPLPYLAPAVQLAEITAVIAVAAYALAGWPNITALRSGWRRLFISREAATRRSKMAVVRWPAARTRIAGLAR